MAEHPPPGPFRARFWRSPLRGPWFTAVLSVALLPGITLMFLTGLASYAAYDPNLAPGNDTTPHKGLLGSWLPGWPAGPSWLYWVNQGVHVTLGLVLIPIVLAKLWSVLPKAFRVATGPLDHSPGGPRLTAAARRCAVFELVTGVMNIQYFYAWPFGFYQAHYYVAWVFIAALLRNPTVRPQPECGPCPWTPSRSRPCGDTSPCSMPNSEPSVPRTRRAAGYSSGKTDSGPTPTQ